MDMENIKIILKVAEYGSINKASLSVYKTQSQVSRIVKDFEQLVNSTIFERSTRGIKVTPNGEKILDYCKQIVRLYDEMILSNTMQHNIDYRGTLNIYNSINIYSTMSEVVSSFSNYHPHISINYSTLHIEKIISAVSEETNALGAISQIYSETCKTGYYEISKDLVYTELLSVPIVALCKFNSPFALKYKSLSAKSLANLPLIQFNPYGEGSSFTDTILQLLGVSSPHFQYSVDDLRMLQQLLNKNAGVYVGILPSPKLLSEGTVAIPIRHKISVGFGTLYRKENNDELVALFNQYLIDWYKKIY